MNHRELRIWLGLERRRELSLREAAERELVVECWREVHNLPNTNDLVMSNEEWAVFHAVIARVRNGGIHAAQEGQVPQGDQREHSGSGQVGPTEEASDRNGNEKRG